MATGKPRKWGVLILFASTTTLICCALPIVLVSIGLGSVVASIYGEHLPFLRWFGLHDHFVFGITSLILCVGAWTLFRPGRMCPTDPELAKACNTAHIWNVRFLKAAVLIWCVGAFATFIMPLF